ncbi:MAG: hypothetical protein Q4G03_02160 [Planctomycetia bacterium]|nr:hypothetical protein [Planctomycetia bacterium]
MFSSAHARRAVMPLFGALWLLFTCVARAQFNESLAESEFVVPNEEAMVTEIDGCLYLLQPDYDYDAIEYSDAQSEQFQEDALPNAEATRRAGFLSACLDVEENLIVRGQYNVTPPTESPTSSTVVTNSSVYSSNPNVIAPPLDVDDQPFQATQIELGDNPTTLQKMFRYRQQISGGYLYMPRSSHRGLGIHELDARILFAYPCKLMENAKSLNNGYFLLTPSFKYNNFSLPKSNNSRIDMPHSVFDAGLTTAFMTNLSDLSVTADFSIGVASSFKKITGKSIYYRGRVEASLPLDDDKQVKILGGVAYYDRIKYKLVPIAGLVWKPNEQNELRLVFPNPKWSRYLTKANETDWWFFVHGDIGGGRWFISDVNAPINGKTSYNVDYNDYRVGVGLTFQCPTRLAGSFEVGGAFKREIRSKAGVMYDPKNSVYLKLGLSY